MSDEKKPMVRHDNLDSSQVRCPCGEMLYIGGWINGDEYDAWIAKHKPHSNGRMREWITDDGMRCLSGSQTREREYDI